MAQKHELKQVNSFPPTGGYCIDWYLDITDPSTDELVSESYLYTQCYDSGGADAGSGQGPDPDNDETALVTTQEWTVATNTGIYYVKSYEQLSGKRTLEPGGGHFTDIQHQNSAVFNISGTQTLHVSYAELAHSVSLFSGARADASVNGKVTYDVGNIPDEEANGLTAFFFSSVFPN